MYTMGEHLKHQFPGRNRLYPPGFRFIYVLARQQNRTGGWKMIFALFWVRRVKKGPILYIHPKNDPQNGPNDHKKVGR